MSNDFQTPSIEMPVSEKPKNMLLKRIWGSLPALFLCLTVTVIVLLSNQIQTKSELIKAENMAKVKQEKPKVNVVILDLSPTTIRDKISLPGVVRPWVELQVLAEVRGSVVRKMVSEGEKISKGKTIAILDSRDYQNAYHSAKASYEASVATLTRLKELHHGKLSTRSQLDNSTAEVENFKAAMDTALLNLDRCTIRSPISGIINRLNIEEGKYLNVSDPVAELIQVSPIKIVVGIPESDVDAVRKIDNYKIVIDALDSKEFEAKKYSLSQTADSMARLYNLTLSLENPNTEIMPDMFARVEIIKKEIQNGISVPLYSIITQKSSNLVYVEKDNLAYAREVSLGLQEGWSIEITKGLQPGEHIIVVGQRNVNDGQEVNVVRSVTNIKELMN